MVLPSDTFSYDQKNNQKVLRSFAPTSRSPTSREPTTRNISATG
jgi:hypothetical protein